MTARKAARKAKPKRGRGRATSLTPDVVRRIAAELRSGGYVETAAANAGIHRDTFYAWMKRGDEDPTSIYGDFSDTIKRALAAAEERALGVIIRAGEAQWQAMAWYLERRYPEKWGRLDRSKVQVTSVVSEGPAVDPRRLSNEDLDQLEALLAKAATEKGEP